MPLGGIHFKLIRKELEIKQAAHEQHASLRPVCFFKACVFYLSAFQTFYDEEQCDRKDCLRAVCWGFCLSEMIIVFTTHLTIVR